MKVNEEKIIHRLALYMFLQKFYAGHLNQLDLSNWKELFIHLNKDVHYFTSSEMLKAMESFAKLKEEDLEDLLYDFNRLFVGPNKLEASPFESSYRSEERAVLQFYTLAVRRSYERAGLVLVKKNNEPDDHLAYELEFICYLLENGLDDETYLKMHEAFLNNHLFEWIPAHSELIRKHTTNPIIIGISYLLDGLLDVEKNDGLLKEGK